MKKVWLRCDAETAYWFRGFCYTLRWKREKKATKTTSNLLCHQINRTDIRRAKMCTRKQTYIGCDWKSFRDLESRENGVICEINFFVLMKNSGIFIRHGISFSNIWNERKEDLWFTPWANQIFWKMKRHSVFFCCVIISKCQIEHDLWFFAKEWSLWTNSCDRFSVNFVFASL